jgi:hypothetical protein
VKLAGGQVAAHRQTGRSIAHSESTREAITSELYSDGGGVPRFGSDATLGPQGELCSPRKHVPGGVSSCHHRCVLSVCVETSGFMHVCCCLEVHASLMRFLACPLNLTAAACRFPAVETAGAAAERALEYSWQPLPVRGPRSRQPRPHRRRRWPLLLGHEPPPRASLDSWSPALCRARSAAAAAGPSLSGMLVRGELDFGEGRTCVHSLRPWTEGTSKEAALRTDRSSLIFPWTEPWAQRAVCKLSLQHSKLQSGMQPVPSSPFFPVRLACRCSS